MREQSTWSNTKLLRALVVFLGTQSWTKQIHIARTATISSDCEDADIFDDDDNESPCVRTKNLWISCYPILELRVL